MKPGNKLPCTSKSNLHVGAPNIGDRQLFDQLVGQIFDKRWFTNNGQMVQALESRLTEYLGVKHCFAVCNATVGLQLVCHALELTGEVIVPAFTFVATPHAVQWEGLTPVFADVDPLTHTICPLSIESLLTDRTSAILGVHVWGQHCDTGSIEQLASRNGLKVFYDAAHAFGCSQGSTMIGNFGTCEVFSFHATKFFNTFEGGAITTNDDDLAFRIKMLRNFGFAGQDQVVYLGTNAKMPEISAAMGLSVFEVLPDILEHNRLNYERYHDHLAMIPGVRMFGYEHLERTNWQYIVLEIDANVFGSTRDELLARLQSEQVIARRYFFPGCHRSEPYRTVRDPAEWQLANTEILCERVLCLPTGTAVSLADVDRVCGLILMRSR